MATLDFIGNPNIRNILFMAEPSGECIAVSTFCRKHNRRGRFLLIRERLRELLDEGPRDFYDMDCKADRSIPSNDLFAKCFIESGAFYTMKQMIMFEGLSLGGMDVKENLDKLLERGRFGYMSLYRSLRA